MQTHMQFIWFFMDTTIFLAQEKHCVINNDSRWCTFRMKVKLVDFYALEIGPADTASKRRLIFMGGIQHWRTHSFQELTRHTIVVNN